MKACTSCGPEYDDAIRACPACGEKGWMAAPAYRRLRGESSGVPLISGEQKPCDEEELTESIPSWARSDAQPPTERGASPEEPSQDADTEEGVRYSRPETRQLPGASQRGWRRKLRQALFPIGLLGAMCVEIGAGRAWGCGPGVAHQLGCRGIGGALVVVPLAYATILIRGITRRDFPV